ncbi:hypothetical protein D3C85_1291000 [compost metagenome]
MLASQRHQQAPHCAKVGKLCVAERTLVHMAVEVDGEQRVVAGRFFLDHRHALHHAVRVVHLGAMLGRHLPRRDVAHAQLRCACFAQSAVAKDRPRQVRTPAISRGIGHAPAAAQEDGRLHAGAIDRERAHRQGRRHGLKQASAESRLTEHWHDHR